MAKKQETESEKSARLLTLFSGSAAGSTTSTNQPALDDLIARIVMGEPPETMKITSEQMGQIFNRLGVTLSDKMRTPNGSELSRHDWDSLRAALSLKIEQEESGPYSNTASSSTPTEEEKAIERKILGDMAESSGRPTNARPAGAGAPSSRSSTSKGAAPAGTPGTSEDEDGFAPSLPGRKYLFIGGVADGCWRVVPEGENHRTAAPPPEFMPLPMGFAEDATKIPDMRSSSYVRVPITIGGGEAAYFGCTDLGPDLDTASQAAFEMLLRGYRPRAYDDCGECRARREYDNIRKR